MSCSIVRKSLIDILDRLAESEKVSEVASEFGIGNSTMADVKNKSRVQSFVSSMESLSVRLKERKKAPC